MTLGYQICNGLPFLLSARWIMVLRLTLCFYTLSVIVEGLGTTEAN